MSKKRKNETSDRADQKRPVRADAAQRQDARADRSGAQDGVINRARRDGARFSDDTSRAPGRATSERELVTATKAEPTARRTERESDARGKKPRKSK